jgi:guanylate kinase
LSGSFGDRGRLFVVSGPSGAGKSTVIRGVLDRKPDVTLSVSATTRPARRGERAGIDYLFVSREEFLARRDRGEFLETAEVYGNFYGTPREPVERALQAGRDVLLEIDIQGAVSVKRALPDAVLIFIEPPDLSALSERLRGRGTEDPESLNKRMRYWYDELKAKGIYDHVIVNDHVGEAVESLLRILGAQDHKKGTR